MIFGKEKLAWYLYFGSMLKKMCEITVTVGWKVDGHWTVILHIFEDLTLIKAWNDIYIRKHYLSQVKVAYSQKVFTLGGHPKKMFKITVSMGKSWCAMISPFFHWPCCQITQPSKKGLDIHTAVLIPEGIFTSCWKFSTFDLRIMVPTWTYILILRNL